MLHDRKIVGNEQIRQVVLLLQIHQKIDDLRLNRHVERRDRLVAYDETGVKRQRAGDAYPLALSARKLMVAVSDRAAGRSSP